MKSKCLRSLRDSEGKGLFGCVVLLALLAAAIFATIKLAPIYYANYNLESEIKTEVSRAGAHGMTDDQILKDIRDLARRNEIELENDNIKVRRIAGQLHIQIDYGVPVDFMLFEKTINFKIEEASFIGSL